LSVHLIDGEEEKIHFGTTTKIHNTKTLFLIVSNQKRKEKKTFIR